MDLKIFRLSRKIFFLQTDQYCLMSTTEGLGDLPLANCVPFWPSFSARSAFTAIVDARGRSALVRISAQPSGIQGGLIAGSLAKSLCICCCGSLLLLRMVR